MLNAHSKYTIRISFFYERKENKNNEGIPKQNSENVISTAILTTNAIKYVKSFQIHR